MTSLGKILIVDDDPVLLDIHSAIIEQNGFVPVIAENGNQGLQILQNIDDIDVILSDISMPELDGYEFCKKVKANPATNSVPFIFVSGLTSLDEKVKGYEYGGDDYVLKPIAPLELVYKIKTVLAIRKNDLKLKHQLEESFNAAMQAMTYSSDLGQIISFYSNAHKAKNFTELSQYVFEFTRSQNLKSSIQFHTQDRILNIGDSGDVSPLEANIIELSRKQSRFYDFGARTIINYKDFSLLIKNMPIEDANTYGKLKDTIGTLCNAIEARTNVLLYDDKEKQREQVLGTVQQVLDEINDSFNNIQKQNKIVIENMISEIDEAMMTLGLMEYQEENIRKIAVHCMETTNENFYKAVQIKEKFELIQDRLSSIFR